MSKIKEVSSFNGSAWGTAVPLGANDSNVDITSSTTNAADSTATLAGLDDTNVTVASGDTDASAWTKFNKFRKRVKNVFGNYVTTSLVANAYKASPASGEVYSAGVLNNYMANVIGISGTSTATVAGATQTVLSAINSLNDNISNFYEQETLTVTLDSSYLALESWGLADGLRLGQLCTLRMGGVRILRDIPAGAFVTAATVSGPHNVIVQNFGLITEKGTLGGGRGAFNTSNQFRLVGCTKNTVLSLNVIYYVNLNENS